MGTAQKAISKSNSQDKSHDSDLADKPVDNTKIVVGQSEKNKKKGKSKTQNTADLFLPGAVTGWIASDRGVVGVATVISTVLGSRDIWRRVGDQEVRREGGNGEGQERR
ncbi:hypothetical protein BOTCAL_0114g00310 [Botryotinia calthae]|uniref:Uncharacterized protein n=1 Tax=Botryotinia calthae TaxID=38488 RepID=A0A4Y8D7F4_9HELO|nr:hypothetical protein BOTCAL_0114g00310 [Botryotinia calthae]